MQLSFTFEEVSILFEYALKHPGSNTVELALKAVQTTNTQSKTFLFEALEKSNRSEYTLEWFLTDVARYNQLDLIIELLQSKSEKIQLAAIRSWKKLKDVRALESLNKQIHESDSATVRWEASVAYQAIVEQPVELQNKPFYIYKELSPLDEMDLVLADYILNRDLANKEVSYLVKHFLHYDSKVRERAKLELSQRGEQIVNSLFEAVAAIHPPITKEIILVFAKYKDPRGAHLIIEWLKSKGSYSDDISDDILIINALGNIGGEEAALYLAETIVKRKKPSFIEILSLKKILSEKGNDNPPVFYLLSEYNNNDYFRRNGAESLADVLGVAALSVLLEGIQDRYREVRKNAELGLTKLGILAVESLIILLDSSHDEGVRQHVCRILGNIGDGRALIPLQELSQSNNRYMHWEAIEAIGKIQDPLSVHILSQWVVSTDRRTRKLAAKGLRNQNYIEEVESLKFLITREEVELLKKRVNDNDKEVRLEAITSLYNLAKQLKEVQSWITAVLLHLLTDKDKEVAALAEENLITLGTWDNNILEQILRIPKTVNNQSIIENISNKIIIKIAEQSEKSKYCEGIGNNSIVAIPTKEIPCPITDTVQFSVSAPRVVCPGRSFILDVWAHFSTFRNEIADLAREAQRNEAITLRSKGPIQVERDTTLIIRINIPDFGVKQKDTIYWGGTTGNCTFPVKVPDQIDFGFYLGVANFYVGPLQIAKLNFDIKVGQQEKEQADLTTREHRIKTAFASYASNDRDKVLGRIQGMLKLLPELDIFLDVASLRSGEDWESRLENEIRIRDVFYLFWSLAASQSPWVEKEWRTALLTKGIDCIDPVPLEPPNETPPPPELSMLHFNEWTLAYQKTTVAVAPLTNHMPRRFSC